MVDFRFEALIQGHGDFDAVDMSAMRLLEAFEDLHGETGPAIGIDVKAKVVEVGFSTAGETLEGAAERGRQILREVAEAAGWKTIDVIGFEGRPEEAEQALAS
jgi:hypothetical protein